MKLVFPAIAIVISLAALAIAWRGCDQADKNAQRAIIQRQEDIANRHQERIREVSKRLKEESASISMDPKNSEWAHFRRFCEWNRRTRANILTGMYSTEVVLTGDQIGIVGATGSPERKTFLEEWNKVLLAIYHQSEAAIHGEVDDEILKNNTGAFDLNDTPIADSDKVLDCLITDLRIMGPQAIPVGDIEQYRLIVRGYANSHNIKQQK